MSQDDYEPALDSTDTPDTGSDTVGEPGEGVALEVRDVVRDRGVKDTTRKLFAKAAESVKAYIDQGEGFDELEPAITDDPPVAAAGASASPSPDASQASKTTPAAAAPASDPVASAVDSTKAAQVELREREIADREKALADREKAIEARENMRERFLENPAAVLRDLVKEYTGADGDDLQNELADVITEMSGLIGAPIPDNVKTRLDAKKALRQAKAYKDTFAKREAELKKQSEAQQQQRYEQDTVRALNSELAASKDKFPHLAAEDDPGAILWEVIKTKHAKDGVVPSWEECAALADQHLKKKTDAWIAKRRHLLATAAPQPAVTASVPQGDPQSRRSATLTNKTAAPVPPSSSSDDESWDRETHRRGSLAKLRGTMKESAT